ncbi:N-acetylmuramoyl-L-alanine amidase [Defluviitalea phaphyphila]|uniref:N-acetylmuramoyl-L-alanine amidase n=1 Tax=Defluviitalea phaphyphila TaxID=1473580 RepID=UPI000730FDD1|nr:N-acetylmuramoyl-L-alanine amidase [Defluviitalea phaphyphila]
MKLLKYIAYILIFIINFSTIQIYAEENTGITLVYDGETHIYNEKPIKLVINGEEINSVMPPIIFDGNTLVPTREVFEAMGAIVEWKADTKEAYIGMEDTLVILKMNTDKAWVNGVDVSIPMEPKIINDKVMIPLRFVAETIGFNVEWVQSERMIKIDNTVEENIEDDIDNNEEIIDEEIDNNKEIEEEIEEKIEEEIEYIDIEDIPSLPTELAEEPIILETDIDIKEKEEINSIIESQSHPTTDIIDVEILDNSYQFKISASGPISSVDHMLWEDKIVIDINNANMELEKTIIEVDDNNFIKSIRASQYSSEPKVVRVVFDLNNPSNYNIIMSEDRQNLIVEIRKTILTSIELTQNTIGDMIIINGDNTPNINVFRLTTPDRLVIDVFNCESSLGFIEELVKGQYISGIRTSQFDENTFRIVLDLNGQPAYEIIPLENNAVAIQLSIPSYKNIKYINDDSTKLILVKPDEDFNINSIVQEDDYMNKIYKITFPYNYINVYGHGIFHIGDGKLDSIEIGLNDEGKTEFKFLEKKVFAYDIYEEDNYIVISILRPREKYKKILVLDPGHGGKDPGAIGNGLYEKELNLDISLRLYDLLKNNSEDIKVYITRTSDTYPTLQDRSNLANEVEADIFLSVHNNSFYSTHRGTEVLYYPTSTSDSSELTGKIMAQIFQKYLVETLGTQDRGIKERPELYVLRTTKMPAVIVEIAFVSNVEDANLLKSDSFKQNAAEALYKGIIDIFEKYPTNR